ncbi:hypothetical protein [Clostridium sp. SM-530-WT-3G]|uniref:hypothetical protein n=1 Tax=Clostridium sp. SM-530-WT-3G TaxID=2725303 RepID=UPI00145F32FB|nr:hypothetical protein [Clostridium sp. SM-530-WT-3G]NME82599.1 hypothetical protein [Clostridium sp. SM-530-WT-3G]
MKIAIDNHGNKIDYKDAVKGFKYLCPYCMEKLNLKTGQRSYFAHEIIKERTPLQRTCPEYHEDTNYKKIDNIADVIYINNGGIPLYLCNDRNKFELRAYFPRLSENCMNILAENKTKIIIDGKSFGYVDNLNYYSVNKIQSWIDVKAMPETTLNEVKRKWLWGIRGINIENDIYKTSKDGGYRLALKANIYVRNNYIMMFSEDRLEPRIKGILFTKIGHIKLNHNLREKTYFIYNFQITKFSEEARQFIEKKGYHLKQESNKIIPLWPPSICNGNELQINNDDTWLYNSNKNSNEYIYEINGGRAYDVTRDKVFKIKNISTINEKAIICTNKIICNQQINSTSAEIQYIINYKKTLHDKKNILPEIIISDSQKNQIDLTQNNKLPTNGKLYINSNIPVKGLVTIDNYCINSSSLVLENINYRTKIIFDANGFGKVFYQYKREKNDLSESNWNLLYIKLCKCSGNYTRISYKNRLLLYWIKKNLNTETSGVYKILHQWIKRRRIPSDAALILSKFEEKIFND